MYLSTLSVFLHIVVSVFASEISLATAANDDTVQKFPFLMPNVRPYRVSFNQLKFIIVHASKSSERAKKK